jgi:electron transfer flavoprotein alpha subunit
MSSIKRIDPRRPFRITPAGLRRIILGETGHAMPDGAAAGISDRSKVKPLRQRTSTGRWLMAVVHTSRGRLDEHAAQSGQAASNR